VYLDPVVFYGKFLDELKQYVHSTTNMLVDARISLFVIYPGLPVRSSVTTLSAMQAGIDAGDDPFAGTSTSDFSPMKPEENCFTTAMTWTEKSKRQNEWVRSTTR